MPKASVCLSTDLIGHHIDLENTTVVVIDILRATSCIVTAFMEEIELMLAFDNADDCYAKKAEGFLVAGERNGSKLDGFDLGNSPYDYINQGVNGKKVAITTTNGTKALYASKGASKVLIGAFLNLSAITDSLVALNKDVLLFCAGWKGLPNAEDTLFAGNVINEIQSRGYELSGDSAALSLDYYEHNAQDLYKVISNSAHAKRLGKLTDIQKDLEYCSKIDATEIVPEFSEGVIKI